MNTFKISEVITGKDSKKLPEERFSLKAFFLDILYFPFSIFSFFVKRYTKITDANWEQYYNEGNLIIEKKLVAFTGFDNRIEFFQLKSNNDQLNKMIESSYFGDFICKLPIGILLREFKSPNDWPKSYLIFINTHLYKIEYLAKSNSTFPVWNYKFTADNSVEITTDNSKNYKRTLTLKMR